MNYEIFIHGDNRGTCPKCSGLLILIGGMFVCIDCKERFFLTGETDYSENVMTYTDERNGDRK